MLIASNFLSLGNIDSTSLTTSLTFLDVISSIDVSAAFMIFIPLGISIEVSPLVASILGSSSPEGNSTTTFASLFSGILIVMFFCLSSSLTSIIQNVSPSLISITGLLFPSGNLISSTSLGSFGFFQSLVLLNFQF